MFVFMGLSGVADKLIELDVGKNNRKLFEGLVVIVIENEDIVLSTRPTSPSDDEIRVLLAYTPESPLTPDKKMAIVGEIVNVFSRNGYSLETKGLLAEAGGVECAGRNT